MSTLSIRDVINDRSCKGCKIDEILKCTVCRERYRDPLVFSRCQHSFCREPCFSGLLKGLGPGDHVQCPECNNKYTVPEDGIDGFPASEVVNRLLRVPKEEYIQYAHDSQVKEEAETKGFRKGTGNRNRIAELRRKRNIERLKKEREEEDKKEREELELEEEDTMENLLKVHAAGDSDTGTKDNGVRISVGQIMPDLNGRSYREQLIEMNKKAVAENGDDGGGGGTSKREAKRQRQKQKQKASAESTGKTDRDQPRDISNAVNPEYLQNVACGMPTTDAEIREAIEKKLMSKERAPKVAAEGAVANSLCEECHERPTANNCMHCKQDICAECHRLHMKPIIRAATKLYKEARHKAQTTNGPVDAVAVVEEVCDCHKDCCGKSIENMKDSSDEDDPRDPREPVMRTTTVKQGKSHMTDSSVKSYFKFKQDLNDQVCARYKALLNPEEIRFLVYISDYVTTHLLPFQQCFVSLLYFRRHVEYFKEFCDTKMRQPMADIPDRDLFAMQKFAQNFIYMTESMHEETIKKPARIKLYQAKVASLEAKLRFATRNDKALSGFFDRKCRYLSLLQRTPFVSYVGYEDEEENREFTRHPLAKNLVLDEDDLGDVGSIRAETMFRYTTFGFYLLNRKNFNQQVLQSTEKLNGKPYSMSRSTDSHEAIYKKTAEFLEKLPSTDDVLGETEYGMDMLRQIRRLLNEGEKDQESGVLPEDLGNSDLLELVLRREGMLPAGDNSEMSFKTEVTLPPELAPESSKNKDSSRAMVTTWADPGDANYEAYCERMKREKEKPLKVLSHDELMDVLDRNSERRKRSEQMYLFPRRPEDTETVNKVLKDCPDLLEKIQESTRMMSQDDDKLDPTKPRSENATVIKHGNYTIYGCSLGHVDHGKFIPSTEDTDLSEFGIKNIKTKAEVRRERRSTRANSKGNSSRRSRAKYTDKGSGQKRGVRVIDYNAGKRKDVVLDKPEDTITMTEFHNIIDEVD